MLYTLPYWSNQPFLIFDIRALWRSAEPFEWQQFGTAGVEGVKVQWCQIVTYKSVQCHPGLTYIFNF